MKVARFKIDEIKRRERLTYKEICEGAGVSNSTIFRMINGRVPQMVGTGVMARLINFFECEPNDLIEIVDI